MGGEAKVNARRWRSVTIFEVASCYDPKCRECHEGAVLTGEAPKVCDCARLRFYERNTHRLRRGNLGLEIKECAHQGPTKPHGCGGRCELCCEECLAEQRHDEEVAAAVRASRPEREPMALALMRRIVNATKKAKAERIRRIFT